MITHRTFTLLCGAIPTLVLAHGEAVLPPAGEEARYIEFPDTADYLTLSVDLHTHSVFSDGHVWPKTRVEEALRDGLDAIAITEHLEWQPHLPDIPHPDRNRAFEIARDAAANTELIVIAGTEITREMPAGHINAVFIDDANLMYSLMRETPASTDTDAFDADRYYYEAGEWPAEEALAAANAQGAFLFWNHPAWPEQAPDGVTNPNDFHLAAFERGELHGIEVANGPTYSEAAFQVALDHDLALIGVSDVHELIDWDYPPAKSRHRPVTLVLARERSAAAMRDALFDRRTVVWYDNLLIGRAEHLDPLLEASLTLGEARAVPHSETAEVTLVNRSDARFLLENESNLTFQNAPDLVEVPPHEQVTLNVNDARPGDSLPFDFLVHNALVAPKQPARLAFTVTVGAN